MNYRNPDALVETAWLAEHLFDRDLRIIDASWHLPTEGRDPAAEYAQKHIPGAAFFDIDAIADPATALPHMMPSAEDFAAMVGALGIGNDHRVVAYDTAGVGSAARAWWMFRAFGHDRVAILNGGLPKWLTEGRPAESGGTTPAPTRFEASLNPALLRTLAEMWANVDQPQEPVLDARSAGRFHGIEPEPRPGLRGGHIPGSRNLPFARLLDPATGTIKPADALAAEFATAGVDPERPLVTSCGSGITACVLALGLYLLGNRDVAVYDGSWTEWGGRADTPIESEGR